MKRSATPGCPAFRRLMQLNRRGLLKLGMLGASGLSLPHLLAAESRTSGGKGTPRMDRSVIILWMRGGPSQLETWDPKPEAPAEIRGEFGTIGTTIPGIRLSEHLPLSAGLMEKWSILRSVHFRPEDGRNLGHSQGDQVCFTGYPPGPNPDLNVYPSCGSIVRRQLQHLTPQMPAYVMVPRNIPGTGSGYFGPSWAALETQADPASNSPFRVPNLEPLGDISPERLQHRRQLLAGIDRLGQSQVWSAEMTAIDDFHHQAIELLTGGQVQRAFDLDSEPDSVRRRYGFYEPFRSRVRAGGDAPNWPQRMLLARRLVQAGVRLVTVDCRWWDTHEDNFWSLKNGFLPRWDQSYSALIEDLDRHGLLENTLVVAWGEMGRAPKINKDAGRDHWPNVMSVAMAGGGVMGGRVIGSSDKHAAEPRDNPILAQDVLATVYRHLGVDTALQYVDLNGRPHPVLPCGRPIHELF